LEAHVISGWAIVLTRSLPYRVPEAMVFLAGLAGMPMRKFTAATQSRE
jgi:membrane protein DedA with SNARE-associated domain